MKNRRELMSEARDHVVPLSRQAVETIDALRPLTGRMAFLFPSITCAQRPLTEAALERLLWRADLAGIHVQHGWRACFSTVMNDRNRSDRFVIDLMLAHKPKDEVEATYNRAQHMSRRREIAQEWADLLLEAMPSAVELVNMRRK